jgi:isopentenyl diphosphate isomerase/L-lactate dehydrogenase-like FMN-dependent dehydrogenase
MRKYSFNRRVALTGLGTFLAGSPLIRSQSAPQLQGEPPGRIAPVGELVNTLEFEPMAQRKLSWALYHEIAGSDRRAFERMTFRPRMMAPTENLDLTTDLFGQKMFAPILVGPLSEQARFHADGELGTVRGAGEAKTAAIISSRSSVPIEKIVSAAKSALWYQVYPEPDLDSVKSRVRQAMQLGFKALCITVGTPYRPPSAGPPSSSHFEKVGNPAAGWKTIDTLRQGLNVPVLLKGIMRPDEAAEALRHGIEGIVVSTHGAQFQPGLAAPIEVLPAIVDAVSGKVPVLIDGSFRRGSDIVKALALGARGVLIGRPVLWGLTAYGATGVQAVMELLQTETAKDMAMCGKANLTMLNRDLVKIHRF